MTDVHGEPQQGGYLPAEIWHDYMAAVTEGQPCVRIPPAERTDLLRAVLRQVREHRALDAGAKQPKTSTARQRSRRPSQHPSTTAPAGTGRRAGTATAVSERHGHRRAAERRGAGAPTRTPRTAATRPRTDAGAARAGGGARTATAEHGGAGAGRARRLAAPRRW